MNRSRLPLFLALLTFGLALLSGFYTYNKLFRTVSALVPVRDVIAGTSLDATAVRVIRVPAGGRPPLALERPEQVVGMYATTQLFADQLLTTRHITDRKPTADPLTALAGDERAVSVPVKLEAVLGGALRPGDRVDVVAARLDDANRPEQAEVLAAGVRVLDLRNATGLSTQASGESTDLGAQVPTSVTLLTSVDQGKALISAVEAKATLYLWLVERGGS